MEMGIIGFGRFGKLMAYYLAKDFRVYVSSRSNKEKEIKGAGAIPATLEEVCKKGIVIPSVPISEFEATLKKITPLLKKGSLVIDVCSVKEYPAEVMKRVLPKNAQILATHPMFGPDSAAGSLQGRKIVLCKIRIPAKRYESIKGCLRKKGLVIIETTPENHDKEIANSLVLTHFIGRSLIDFGAKEIGIDTKGYRKMMEVMKYVENDTWQLFKDMNHYNKYSKKVRQEFIEAVARVNRRLEK